MVAHGAKKRPIRFSHRRRKQIGIALDNHLQIFGHPRIVKVAKIAVNIQRDDFGKRRSRLPDCALTIGNEAQQNSQQQNADGKSHLS